MRHAFDILRRFEYWLAGLILLAGLAIVSLQIVARSFLDVSFLWSEELSRYLLIWTTYLGAVAAVQDRSHIRAEVLIAQLPRGGRRAIEILVALACCAFCSALVYAGVMLVQDSMWLGIMSADSNLPIPIWVFQAVVPFGFALMALRFALRVVALIRGDVDPALPHDPDAPASGDA